MKIKVGDIKMRDAWKICKLHDDCRDCPICTYDIRWSNKGEDVAYLCKYHACLNGSDAFFEDEVEVDL